jgi:lipid-A-disaccharide synthase-like uncharacterized protein
VLFFGRFYVQWIASELRRESVMPLAFWYMSACGSLMLLTYAVVTRSPIGALGHNMNIVIYGRNLAHIWRRDGRLTPTRNRALHAVMAIVVVIGAAFVILTWYREYEVNREASAAVARATWLWLGVGLLGQALFAARFLVQWIATERKRESVIPVSFWYISLAAAAMQSAAFLHRQEWVFAIGQIATMFIYARNLYFIHATPAGAKAASLEG